MSRLALLALGLPSVQSVRFLQNASETTCAPLHNAGSYVTVKVAIGTPPQQFDLVADTGSDSIIVESCACVRTGHCSKESKCFQGGDGKSSTFRVPKDPKGVQITFGSGPIDAVIASDVASLGGIKAKMDNGVLLMVDKKLDFEKKGSTDLEGIIGLGVPQKRVEGEPDLGEGFLATAHIGRFSMCFNDEGRDGVLRLGNNDIAMDKPLGGVGVKHWGLDFRGISLGNAEATTQEEGRLAICDESSMQPNQKTPCGAIVDSGTTLIMAPAEHLARLFLQLCDAWPRCQKAIPEAESDDQDDETVLAGKIKAFITEASSCEDFDSLPSLFFHVRGQDGTAQAVELTPNDYMIETKQEVTKVVKKWLLGVIPVAVKEPTARKERVCMPAFHHHKMNTEVNGPVWMFGTPFFYKYTVAYDRNTKPPAISFNQGECTECGSLMAHSFLASSVQRTSGRRILETEPRIPFFNTTHSL